MKVREHQILRRCKLNFMLYNKNPVKASFSGLWYAKDFNLYVPWMYVKWAIFKQIKKGPTTWRRFRAHPFPNNLHRRRDQRQYILLCLYLASFFCSDSVQLGKHQTVLWRCVEVRSNSTFPNPVKAKKRPDVIRVPSPRSRWPFPATGPDRRANGLVNFARNLGKLNWIHEINITMIYGISMSERFIYFVEGCYVR